MRLATTSTLTLELARQIVVHVTIVYEETVECERLLTVSKVQLLDLLTSDLNGFVLSELIRNIDKLQRRGSSLT